MTPKEKAAELYSKVYGQTPTRWTESEIEEDKRFSKQCALIAVNEILNLEPPELSYMEPFSNSWWQEVKQEIEKL